MKSHPVSVTIDDIDMYRLRRFPVAFYAILYTIQQSDLASYSYARNKFIDK